MKVTKRLAYIPLMSGIAFIFLPNFVFGQGNGQNDEALQLNTITTAVPFLSISPDARHSALGDAGVATSPDDANNHWNPSKWAFIEDESGLAISYTPWLRNLGINDMGIMYLAGHHRVSERTVLAASLKYFSLGNITFTDINGTEIRDHKPNEFSLDVAAGTKLGRKVSGGIAGRFIYSNLTDGLGNSKRAAMTGAVDVSAYYKDEVELFGRDGEFGLGINISNIGAKMSYTTATGDKDFIPTNLRLGQATKIFIDEYNSLTWALDFNKLLVPSPQYDEATGQVTTPDVSVASGIFSSFGDAPRGFSEEMEEINISTGLEYWYEDIFALRAGYFYEHPNKGDRQFFTAGFGLKLNVFGLDASYLIANRNNPLANTFRFTLSFSFDAFKEQQEATEE